MAFANMQMTETMPGDVLILENVDKKDLTNEDFGW